MTNKIIALLLLSVISRSTILAQETGTVSDIEGNIYKTVKIGNQWWMAENLKSIYYSDNTNISSYGKVFAYDNDVLNADTLGRLYTRGAALRGAIGSENIPSGIQGACPDGWHIPSRWEFEVLTNYVGGEDVAGGKLKDSTRIYWLEPNVGATNEYGFSALPAGMASRPFYYPSRPYGFLGKGQNAYFYTTSKNASGQGCYEVLRYNNSVAESFYDYDYKAFSIRCVKDPDPKIPAKGGEIVFQNKIKPFDLKEFYPGTKSYIYYYLDNNLSFIDTGISFKFNFQSYGSILPCEAKVLQNNILQLCVDLRDIINPCSITIEIPDSVVYNNKYFLFRNKPPIISKDIVSSNLSQTINIFGGGSLGAKLIAGGAGIGPSVAAASLSIEGNGGLGLVFTHENSGIEYVSRRFEGGISLLAETPAINPVAGNINVGANGEISLKTFNGQTMLFSTDILGPLELKAKAAFILESYILGGVEFSPFTAAIFKSLKKELLQASPDLLTIYDDLYYSREFGISLGGQISIGMNVGFGEGKDQLKLNLLDAGFKLTGFYEKSYLLNSSTRSIKLGYSREFNTSSLDFEIMGASNSKVDFGSIFDFKYGESVALNAGYNDIEGLTSLKYSFETTKTAEISTLEFSPGLTYDFIIPQSAINRHYKSNSLIKSVSSALSTGLSKDPIILGLEYYANHLDSLFIGDPDNLSRIDDHITIEINKSRLIGKDLGVKVELDAALGAGGGLMFGLHFSYFDELKYTKEKLIVAHDQILPMMEKEDLNDTINLFKFRDELNDLFKGAVLLISDRLKEFVLNSEYAIEAGKRFLFSMTAGTLTGSMLNTGYLILRSVDPSLGTVKKGMFLDPKLINVYSSHRIIHEDNKGNDLKNEKGTGTLYIVSQNINVTLLDNDRQIVNTFSPINLSIAIENAKLDELKFGEFEKKLTKAYFYDTDSLFWVELSGRLNATTDSVSVQITKSGSYALGIEINPFDDNTLPQIIDYFPKENETTSSLPTVWAKISDGPSGSGIDFSKTNLKLDDVEIPTLYDPINNIMSYEISDSLKKGLHTYNITVVDLNGNISQKSTIFNVESITTEIRKIHSSLSILCYPNPATYHVTIALRNILDNTIKVEIFDQNGHTIKTVGSILNSTSDIDFTWDLKNNNGNKVQSGIYFIRIKTENSILIKKLIVN